MTFREWRNNEWEKGPKGRDQWDLKYMLRKILDGADLIENNPTPGASDTELSRCIVATSKLLPNTKFIIHVSGFTIEDISEMVYTKEEMERMEAEK